MSDGQAALLVIFCLIAGSVFGFGMSEGCNDEQRRADCYERSCTVGYPEYIKQKCVCVVGEMKN